MPRFDGTGPAGAGPMTGRGFGPCGCGYGGGWRRNSRPGRGMGRYFNWQIPQTNDDKKKALADYRQALKEELEDIKKEEEDLK